MDTVHVVYHSRLWEICVAQGMLTHEVYDDAEGRSIAIMVPKRFDGDKVTK